MISKSIDYTYIYIYIVKNLKKLHKRNLKMARGPFCPVLELHRKPKSLQVSIALEE